MQGDPLSVVILHCVLKRLLERLIHLPGLSVVADDLLVVASSWENFEQTFDILELFLVQSLTITLAFNIIGSMWQGRVMRPRLFFRVLQLAMREW